MAGGKGCHPRKDAVRVLVVSNMWPREGRPAFGSFVASEVESLRARGVDIAVHVIPGERSAAAYFAHVPLIRRSARRLGADLVHAHYGLAGWSAAWSTIPLIVSFCGDDLLGTPGALDNVTVRSRVAIRMSQFAATRAAAIICKSANLAAALERPADRERAHVIPNGVDLTLFHPGDRADSRRRLGLAPDVPLVLFPHDRRQFRQKGFALAHAAMRRLEQSIPDAQLLAPERVPHAQMPDYYRAADCLLLTSRSEGSPNVVKEALACALPVVSVAAGDVQRWVDAVAGCRLVAAEPDAVMRGLREVLARRERVDASQILAQLDRQVIAQQIVEVYETTLRRAA